MRWLLIGLLTANVCYFLWAMLSGGDRQQDVRPHLESGLALISEEIAVVQILGEFTVQPQQSETITSPELPSVAGSSASAEQPAQRGASPGAVAVEEPAETAPRESFPEICYRAGPFDGEQQQRSFLRSFAESENLWLEPGVVSRDLPTLYRVYLPPAADREAAVRLMAQVQARLRERGVEMESFVMSSGELANGIALGLFQERSNASNVQSRLADVGYEAVMREEPRRETELWVDIRHKMEASAFESRWTEMTAQYNTLQRSEKLCETIAPEQ